MSRTKLGTGRTLNKPITWLLRDEFSDTRAAGAVNGTMPTPGPGGARVVTDTENKLSIAGGDATFAGGRASPGFGNPALWYTAVARSPGVMLFSSVNFSTLSSGAQIGYSSSRSGGASVGFQFDAFPQIKPVGGVRFIDSVSLNVSYPIMLGLRASGEIFAMLVSNNWLLMSIFGSNTTGTLYPTLNNHSAVCLASYLRIPADLWLPTPICSDGFGSTFGTTDGLGHAEGVSGGIGSGGGNVAWTQQVGAWANSAGKAAAATLSGGVAVATVPTPTADVFAKVKVTRSAGSGGMVLRWTDSSNYLYAEHAGTNAYLKQVLSGSTTTLITAAATYSAGAELVADLNGVNGRLYWNNALVGSTGSINSGLTATLHGLRSTDTGGIQLDDLCIYAKGTGGEYNLLNRYVNL